MTELGRVAVLNAHMQDLQSRVDNLIDERERERSDANYVMEELRQALWETEAALGDAERELVAVKNTAIVAIRKLSECMKEKDALRSRVDHLEEERDALNSCMHSMQQRLHAVAGAHKRRTSPPVDETWTIVSPSSKK